MTDTVFKFVSMRPPELIEDESYAVNFVRPGPGIDVLIDDKFSSFIGRKLFEFAKGFIESDAYVAGDRKLVKLVMETLSGEGVDSEKLEEALGVSTEEFLKQEITKEAQAKLWESYYAQVVAPGIKPEDRAGIADALRAYHVLKLVASGVSAEQMPDVEAFGKLSILAPKDLVTFIEPKAEEPKPELDEIRKKLDDMADQVRRFVKMSNELRRDPRTIQRPQPKIEREKIDGQHVRSSGWLSKLIGTKRELQPGTEIVTVTDLTPWPWTDPGTKTLTKETQEFLSGRDDLKGLSALEIVDKLDEELRRELSDIVGGLSVDSHALMAQTDAYLYLADVLPTFNMVGNLTPNPIYPTPADRSIRPLGIGDLMIVEQELLRYTAGEIAHIENVMAAEVRERMHQRVRETEEIIITETEKLEETEKDLQTTERFELHNEAERIIETEMSAEAGVEVSGSYGFVSVTAHGDFALSRSQSQSEKNSSDFAREVTERSVSRVVERTREERTRRTLERFEETNRHEFNNIAQGATHIRGLYRWVDKYYQARLINYGRRLMMEFVVPEPAAFYLHVESGQSAQVPFKRPKPPTYAGWRLKPSHLTSGNVDQFVRDYHVANVEPYPAASLRVGASFTQSPGAGQDENVHFAAESDKFVVPNGYTADGGYAYASAFSGYEDRYMFLHAAGSPLNSMSLSGLSGSIPVSANGWGSSFNFQMTFTARSTEETRRAWQIDTFDKIMTAYQQLESRYQQALAAAEIAAGIAIQGRNPDINRQIEREELQRSVTNLLTNHFQQTIMGPDVRYNEMFNATYDNGPFGYPRMDADEVLVEGKIIQFFEQAFEWQNMTYLFHPYFWGRMEKWDETFDKLDHPDPAFASFLRAGSARVVVPARPAYTEAVLHYIETSAIWNGGEPPTIDDPLYVSIVEELRARSDERMDPPNCADGVEYPCLVDEWEVKLPTSLVWLQDDGELPDLSEDDGGN